MSEPVKYCKYCVHCRPDWGTHWLMVPVLGWMIFLILVLSGEHLDNATCALSPISIDSNLVRKKPQRFDKCFLVRASSECGYSAKMFEPKVKK